MAVGGHTGSRLSHCRGVISHQGGAVMTVRAVIACCRYRIMVDAAGEDGGCIMADQAVIGMRGRRAAQGRIAVTHVANLCGTVTACTG